MGIGSFSSNSLFETSDVSSLSGFINKHEKSESFRKKLTVNVHSPRISVKPDSLAKLVFSGWVSLH